MYAKTDKPEHLSKFTITQNVKVDKSQCSLRPKQHSLKLTNNDAQYVEQKSNEHQKDMGNTITALK